MNDGVSLGERVETEHNIKTSLQKIGCSGNVSLIHKEWEVFTALTGATDICSL